LGGWGTFWGFFCLWIFFFLFSFFFGFCGFPSSCFLFLGFLGLLCGGVFVVCWVFFLGGVGWGFVWCPLGVFSPCLFALSFFLNSFSSGSSLWGAVLSPVCVVRCFFSGGLLFVFLLFFFHFTRCRRAGRCVVCWRGVFPFGLRSVFPLPWLPSRGCPPPPAVLSLFHAVFFFFLVAGGFPGPVFPWAFLPSRLFSCVSWCRVLCALVFFGPSSPGGLGFVLGGIFLGSFPPPVLFLFSSVQVTRWSRFFL